MAVYSDVTSQNRFAAGASRAFEGAINFLVSISTSSSRARQIEALSRLSDAQLAERGMKREDIVRHVFRDVYYV